MHKRVSVFKEGIVGTVILAPSSGNVQIDLDDGKTRITRYYIALRLIPIRDPGNFIFPVLPNLMKSNLQVKKKIPRQKKTF